MIEGSLTSPNGFMLRLEKMRPAARGTFSHLTRRCIHLWELVPPLPRLCSIYQRSGGGEIPFFLPLRRNNWVQWSAPCAVDEVDVNGRITSRAHSPQHLLHVGRIYVVDDYCVSACVCSRSRLRRQVKDLFCMSRVALLDRDHRKEAGSANFVLPSPENIRPTYLTYTRIAEPLEIAEVTWT